MTKNKDVRKGKKKHWKKKKKPEVKAGTSISKNKVSNNWAAFVQTQFQKPPFIIKRSMDTPKKQARKSTAATKTPAVTKVLALDCEMVGNENDEDMLARVSVVNFKMECIFDKYVKPSDKVGDYRTRFSGIRPSDLDNAPDFDVVRNEVKSLLHNKILVGHALVNDFHALKFGHHKKLIRDTSHYAVFKEISNGRTPSLKKLVKHFLEENIQEGEHNSIEDAKAAMKLYIKFRHEWEKSIINSKFSENSKKKPSIPDDG